MKNYEAPSPLPSLLNDEPLEKVVKSSGYNPTPLVNTPPVPARVIFREKDGHCFFFSEQARQKAYEAESLMNELYGHGYEGFCEVSHVLGDKESIEVVRKFEKDVEEYKTFFSDTITKGYVDRDQFNVFASRHIGKSMIFISSGDPFHLTLDFTPNVTDTIQAYIERNFIIIPALNPSNRTLELMRICPQCQKFFLAKAAKTIFCSPSCRVMYQRGKE